LMRAPPSTLFPYTTLFRSPWLHGAPLQRRGGAEKAPKGGGAWMHRRLRQCTDALSQTSATSRGPTGRSPAARKRGRLFLAYFFLANQKGAGRAGRRTDRKLLILILALALALILSRFKGWASDGQPGSVQEQVQRRRASLRSAPTFYAPTSAPIFSPRCVPSTRRNAAHLLRAQASCRLSCRLRTTPPAREQFRL